VSCCWLFRLIEFYLERLERPEPAPTEMEDIPIS